MNTLKAIARRLLFPPPALVLLLIALGGGLLIDVFSKRQSDTPLAYAAYALSAYALTVACAGVPRAVHLGRRVRANEGVDRLMGDYALRTHAALCLGLALNLAFAAFKLAAGALLGSYWLVALGFYYAVLALMRFLLLRGFHAKAAQPDRRIRTYRLTGALMFALNVGMGAIIFQVVRDNQTYRYPGFIIYAFAAYAFYKIISAAVALIRRRGRDNLLLSAARQLNLAVAMMSIFSLQTALLSTFGGGGSERLIFNAASGGIICLSILCISVWMVIRPVPPSTS